MGVTLTEALQRSSYCSKS